MTHLNRYTTTLHYTLTTQKTTRFCVKTCFVIKNNIYAKTCLYYTKTSKLVNGCEYWSVCVCKESCRNICKLSSIHCWHRINFFCYHSLGSNYKLAPRVGKLVFFLQIKGCQNLALHLLSIEVRYLYNEVKQRLDSKNFLKFHTKNAK